MTEKLYEIVSKILDVPISQITDESGPENIDSWDSFTVYVLLDEIESNFNTKFSLEEILDIKTVSDIKKILHSHGVI